MAPQSAKEHFLAALAAKLNETPAKVDSNLVPQPVSATDTTASTLRTGRSGPRTKLKVRRYSVPNFERHSRKCQICHHEDIDAIEEAFVNWTSAHKIMRVFKIDADDAIYRHARATGLDVARRQNVRFAVEKVVEHVDHVTITSSSILRAVRALSCLNERGQWTELPSTHIIVASAQPGFPSPEPSVADETAIVTGISNRGSYEELELDANDSKQRADDDSNRGI